MTIAGKDNREKMKRKTIVIGKASEARRNLFE